MNKKFSTLMAASLVLAGSLWSGDALAETVKISTLAELQAVTNWSDVKGQTTQSDDNKEWTLTSDADTLLFTNKDIIKFGEYAYGKKELSQVATNVNYLTIGKSVVILAEKDSKGIEGHLKITKDGVVVKGLAISNKSINNQPAATKTAIEVAADVTKVTLVDNVITEPKLADGFMTYGILLRGDAKDMTIEGNKITAKAFVKGNDSYKFSFISAGLVFLSQTGKTISADIAAKNTFVDCGIDFFDERTITETKADAIPYYYSAQVTYNSARPEAVLDVLDGYNAKSKSLVIKGASALDVISAINAAKGQTYTAVPATFAVIADGANVVKGDADPLNASLKIVAVKEVSSGSNTVTLDKDNSTADIVEYTATELNKILGDGFILTLTDVDDKAIDNGDVVSEKLLTATGTTSEFKLMSGKKYLTVVAEQWGNITDAPYKVKFVDKEADATEFKITNVDGKLAISSKVGSDNVYLTVVSTDLGTVLTAVKSDVVKTDLTAVLSKTNMVNGKVDEKNNPLLNKYVTFTFATADKNIAAKDGKVLGLDNNGGNAMDLVAADRYLQSKPEGQWAVTLENDSEYNFKFTNREKNVSFSASALYLIDAKTNKYAVVYNGGTSTFSGGVRDTFVINGVDLKLVSKDYYVNYKNDEIKDTQYKMAIASTETTDFYVTENHEGKHLLGLTKETANSVNWKVVATKDTVLLINNYGKYDEDGDYVAQPDTMKIPTYAFQNVANDEYMTYAPEKLALDEDAMYCDPNSVKLTNENDLSAYAFVLKKRADGLFNIIGIKKDGDNYVLDLSKKLFGATTEKNGQVQVEESWEQINSNDLFKLTPVDAPEYHFVENGFGEKVSIFREENDAQVLYEKRDIKSVVDNDTLSFLNIDNVYQFDKINPSMFVDTAYINRGENTRWQYLLAVNPEVHNPDTCTIPGHPRNDRMVTGRYLINLIDTANVYGATHLHNNPYINRTEAGEYLAKLSFVDAMHINDTLIINRKGGEAVKLFMDTPDFNVAKFAFRYVNPASESDKTFKIQTQYKDYKNGDLTAKDNASNEGYLKWINGTVVVVNGYANGDVFGINENEDRDAVANEDVTVSSISVVATDGAVIIKGAEGKKVVISNVLGQTVANAVISSDNATISAPAGVVVVAVEGEAAVKAIVK
ncbi:DUF6383 domain-containing protein [Parabacteroides sp. GYB001]|uniref:DUF6383 domain-containing protein n=1 Tax=Parabacteroides leei TaxID=2939491 RepID=UPI002016D088|nr:DUF6383 domain-containing protein [Parabacteroides leei]MCL3850721.1 DUF6383 domain-containing protein [Parabacteroides leei]